MRMLRFILASALVLLSLTSFAAKPREASVKGTYTYYGDGTLSPAECKRRALEGARLEALAKEFGTIVSQNIVQHDLVNSQGESTYFSALSATEVKGEWLADEGEPQYNVSVDKNGHLVVQCTVKGRARELSNEAVEFDALVLRNGTTRQCADTQFRDGDDMRVLLKSPVDGYVAIFLADDDHNVFRLLPYRDDSAGEVKVKHGQEYLFFDPNSHDSSFGSVDEICMSAENVEHNKVYVVMAPKRFSLPVTHVLDESAPLYLSLEDFNSWLAKTRRADTQMGVKVINIQINPK